MLASPMPIGGGRGSAHSRLHPCWPGPSQEAAAMSNNGNFTKDRSSSTTNNQPPATTLIARFHAHTLAFPRRPTDRTHSLHSHIPPAAMVSRIAALLLSGVAVLHAQAQTVAIPTELVGTWNSKANSTMTGPVRTRRAQTLLRSTWLIAPTGLLRSRQREIHRATAHRHQLLLHCRRPLRGGILPRHREPYVAPHHPFETDN